jgi:hypothetical protein
MQAKTIAAGLIICLCVLGGHAASATRAADPPTIPTEIAPAARNCGGISLAARGVAPAASPPELGWSLAGPIDAAATASQLRPDAVGDAGGRVYAIWQEQTASDPGNIYAAPLGDAPGGARRAVRVDDSGAAATEQSLPTLAVSPGGQLHAVWQDRRGGAQAHLYYASSADGGASWSANMPVTAALATRSHTEPSLAVASDGGLALAWRARGASGSVIYYSQRGAAGWSAPVPLSSGPVNTERGLPRLAFDREGGLLAAWEDQRAGDSAIYTARRASGAAAWGADAPASPGGVAARRPSLGAAADGALYIAYEGAPGIYLMRSTDGGATWGQPRRADDGDGTHFTNPRVAIDARGRVHCIWCQLKPGVVADIIAARSDDGGHSWAGRAPLASSTGTANPLALAVDKAGNVHALWTDDRDNPVRPQLYSAVWRGNSAFLPFVQR